MISGPPDDARVRWLLPVALLVTGLAMRIAVTSVGAVLGSLEDGLHVSGGVAGVITTLPVLCFAGLGALTPRAARRVGPERMLAASLAVSTAGLVLRSVAGNAGLFVAASVLALAGGAVANVLMPSMVKRWFPTRIGSMTALYTTGLAIGTTAGAGLTVPIGDLGPGAGWRFGLGAWAALTALAVLPWLPLTRHRDTGAAVALAGDDRPAGPRELVRSRTVVALTVFFGAQSMQAYISFGWFARFLSAHDVSDATAGAMVAVFAAMAIPVSVVVPRVPAARQRAVTLAMCGCAALAYVGLALAPAATAWPSMVLAGIGGGTFPMVLTLIGQRCRSAGTTAAVSAFVQAVGYIVAGTGPLLFGALYGGTGSWALPLAVLFVALAVTVVAAWPVTARRYVDDELGAG